MSLDKKFSVVIPCYNHGDRLDSALRSCCSQTYLPYEIIIIDDGSDLETKNKIRACEEKYRSYNIRSVSFAINRGVSAARNKGLGLASGDFICFLDSDDEWHPDKLKVINGFLKERDEVLSLAHDFTYDKSLFGQSDFNDRSMEYSKITSLHILFKNPFTTPSLVVSRKTPIRFNESMRYAEDHDFILRLSRLSGIYFLKQKLVLINRRIGSKGGLSGDVWKMRKGEMKMYLHFCESSSFLYPCLPFFIVYSLIKHLRFLLRRLLHH